MNDKHIERPSSDKEDNQSSLPEESEDSSTHELAREEVIEQIPIKPCLKIIGIEGKNKVIYLGEGEVTIGRSSGCDIQLPVNTVSGKHARIVFRNEGFVLEDLGSKNGTYVNGVKTVKCILRNNDQVTTGEVRIIFVEETGLLGK
jgi:pSer/pThr/pTyr-binding forkhead associated (FHA) protein